MDSIYKTQLMSKLDSITKLERSGYGIPREKNNDIITSVFFILSLVALLALYVALV